MLFIVGAIFGIVLFIAIDFIIQGVQKRKKAKAQKQNDDIDTTKK